MRISENLLLQLVEREPDDRDVLVFVDESTGQEGQFPTADIVDFTKRLYGEIKRGVETIEVDGIIIGRPAFPNLIVALGYFAGIAPHPKDARQFSASDSE